MTKPHDGFAGKIDRELVIPVIDYGIPYRTLGSHTAMAGPWPRLSGKDYILARPLEWVLEPNEGREYFRVRLVRRRSFYERYKDRGPVIYMGNRDDLVSWQFDYDLYFGRTIGGRQVLQAYGLGIDKFRNAQHPAHTVRTV